MGVLANSASSKKNNISVDYASAFSKDKEQAAEKTIKADVSSKAAAKGNFVDNDNDGICDNYADGACPQDGTGCGYHHGNGHVHGHE